MKGVLKRLLIIIGFIPSTLFCGLIMFPLTWIATGRNMYDEVYPHQCTQFLLGMKRD